jgi:hypothetical protein
MQRKSMAFATVLFRQMCCISSCSQLMLFLGCFFNMRRSMLLVNNPCCLCVSWGWHPFLFVTEEVVRSWQVLWRKGHQLKHSLCVWGVRGGGGWYLGDDVIPPLVQLCTNPIEQVHVFYSFMNWEDPYHVCMCLFILKLWKVVDTRWFSELFCLGPSSCCHHSDTIPSWPEGLSVCSALQVRWCSLCFC